MERLKMSVLYGADAVYLAGQMFGMRAAADNFTVQELYEAARRVKEIAGEVSFRLSEISEEDPGDLADRIRKAADTL